MPNAGIQACRSTNWNSADAGLKRLHISSVSPNTSTDTTSAMLRASRASPSSSRTKSSTIAPAIGRAISVERIGNVISEKSAYKNKGHKGHKGHKANHGFSSLVSLVVTHHHK